MLLLGKSGSGSNAVRFCQAGVWHLRDVQRRRQLSTLLYLIVQSSTRQLSALCNGLDSSVGICIIMRKCAHDTDVSNR